jgi:hypothetical protein
VHEGPVKHQGIHQQGAEPQERQRSLKGPREQRALHIRNDDEEAEVLISAVILGPLVQGLFPSRLQAREEEGEGVELLLYDWAWEERRRD